MSEEYQSWVNAASLGWEYAEAGKFGEALEQYQFADYLARNYWPETPFWVNPELSLLRHKTGSAEGYVRPYSQTEDVVVAIEVRGGVEEEGPQVGMKNITLNQEDWVTNIAEFMNNYTPEPHILKNISGKIEHAMVMSTGRCGTVALFRLFQTAGLMPFHSYFLNVSYLRRFQFMCELSDNSPSFELAHTWARTRAAEWIGAENEGSRMIGINHMDTIFAPVFAAIHPNSTIIHLRRDPVKVFKSFITKGQWNHTQLCPCLFNTNPYAWSRISQDIPYTMAWYIRFTEVFANAMKTVLRDRVLELSSDKLFDHDRDEMRKLLDFTDCSLTLNNVNDHFKIKHNEKAHKTAYSQQAIEYSTNVFKQYYKQLGGEL